MSEETKEFSTVAIASLSSGTLLCKFEQRVIEGGGERRALDAEAEIASLRAELEKAHARIDAMAGELADSKEYGLIQWRKKDLALLDAERARAAARRACRADTGDCIMDESPAVPCDEKNCRYVAMETARRQDAETIARLTDALEVIVSKDCNCWSCRAARAALATAAAASATEAP